MKKNTILMFFSVLTLCTTFSCSSLFAREVSVTTAEDAISIDGHYFVDLALPSGKLWAMTNVGASTPYEDGDYFAWGETETKSSYTKDNYRFQSDNSWPKVHPKGTGAVWDPMEVLDAEYDAASANWGGNCQMPNWDDVTELLSFCEWTWTDGGYIIRGRNGKSIFLPASGFKDGSQLTMHGKQGKYWTGTSEYGSSFLFIQKAKFPITGLPSQKEDDTDHYQGRTVRPVAQSKTVGKYSGLSTYYESKGVTTIWGAIRIGNHYFVDLDLPSGKLWARTNVGASTPYEDGDYYAWGEIETVEEKPDYGGFFGYKWGDSSGDGLRKYNEYDHKTVLDPEDDVAIVKWGKACRMPSPEDFNELLVFCEWQWCCGGYVVKGRNGNAIFLPVAGILKYGYKINSCDGYYWTNTGNNGDCKEFTFDYSNAGKLEENRPFESHSVRPIAEKASVK